MTQELFLRHKEQNPQLTYTLIKSEFIPSEKTWCKEYGVYNVFKRNHYLKSNNKKCYVDAFVKEIKVERNKLHPSNNGYTFRIQSRYLKEVLKEAGL